MQYNFCMVEFPNRQRVGGGSEEYIGMFSKSRKDSLHIELC